MNIYTNTIVLTEDDPNSNYIIPECSSSSSQYCYRQLGDTLVVGDNRTIFNSNDTGYKGEICFDDSYMYYCFATNSWARVAISPAGW